MYHALSRKQKLQAKIYKVVFSSQHYVKQKL